jgi:phage shock protein C
MNEHRLLRSSKDRMLFGVCGGLGAYFDVDATLVRVIFVLITFAGGSGILAYIVLAIIMRSETSVASSPRDSVRSNIADLGDTAREMGEQIRASFSGSAPDAAGGQVVDPVPTTKRDRHATAGLILVLIGLMFLMSNILPGWINWDKMWPLILVVIGLAMFWGRGRR